MKWDLSSLMKLNLFPVLLSKGSLMNYSSSETSFILKTKIENVFIAFFKLILGT
jgi:hypothetical protein